MKFAKNNNRSVYSHMLCLILALVCINSANLSLAQTYHNLNDSTLRGQFISSTGMSSMGGYSFSIGAGVIIKSNNIELSCGVDREVGNRTSGSGLFGISIPYNDKFYHVELLYGRIYQNKRFVGSLSVGVNSFLYRDKKIGGIDLGHTIQGDYVLVDSQKGFGIVVKPTAGALVGNKVVLGAEINCFINNVIQITNVGFQCKVLI